MDTPYVGYIALVGFNFAPRGWALCNGQLLPINQYEALFQLIGTTFGGDGNTTFGLPDLRGRVPIHAGQSQGTSNYVLGQLAGSESIVLTSQQIPSHNHIALCVNNTAGNSNSPLNTNVWGRTGSEQLYNTNAPGQAMLNPTFTASGRSTPHENRQPILAVNFIMALEGIFPPHG
jgi:microcystin-dependent protein